MNTKSFFPSDAPFKFGGAYLDRCLPHTQKERRKKNNTACNTAFVIFCQKIGGKRNTETFFLRFFCVWLLLFLLSPPLEEICSMFGLASGLWEYAFAKKEVFILIAGIGSVGKTTFLEQLKAIYKGQRGFTPPPPSPTVGLNIAKVEAGPIKLTFWDLGGQRSLRPIWEKYMGTADACVFVVDSACSVGELEEARSVLEWMMSSGSISRVPYLIVANKQDLSGARTPSELAQDLKLEDINLPPHAVQSMCALKGKGVEEGMSWLVDQVLAIDSK